VKRHLGIRESSKLKLGPAAIKKCSKPKQNGKKRENASLIIVK
jgi:hypothetical protein